MNEILARITHAKQQLSHSAFLKALASNAITTEEKLSFVPAMAFFVMGFRDILSYLRYPHPKTPLEKSVNRHCDEDAGHWEWYVRDLQRLGYSFSAWGPDLVSFFDRLWSNDTQACRDLVYTTLHYAKRSDDPAVRLVIIEVMEATFGAFIDALHQSTSQSAHYSELQFFGLLHYQAERDHELGSWIAGNHDSSFLKQITMTTQSEILGLEIVDELFRRFDKMFHQWHQQRENFATHAEPRSLAHGAQ